MAKTKPKIGRAKTPLVFCQGQKAVISAIIVRGRTDGGKCLRFCGTVTFSGPVRDHIKGIILPIIDNIVGQLGLDPEGFEISALNLGAASGLDVGLEISGYSADTAILLAMLSYALQIPIGDDLVTTGHIASVEGDISPVKAIPAKLEAAMSDNSIGRFVHPDLEHDMSMKTLSPNERDRSVEAILAAGNSLQATAVTGIGELVREVLAEENIILASLRRGFFGISITAERSGSPLQDAITFLADSNEQRFWDVLKRRFLEGDYKRGKRLLHAYAGFFIGRQLYPAGTGARLFQLNASLPPAIRRLKMDYPILDKGMCVRLSSFARETDYDDAPLLFDAICGRIDTPEQVVSSVGVLPEAGASGPECLVFDTVTSQISEQALAKRFGIAIDSARGSYTLGSSTVKSYEEFIDTVQAFYVHLQSHISSTPGGPLNMDQVRSDAIDLLDSCFSDENADEVAFARARDGIQGGMGFILDALSEQFKREKQEAYVKRVFKEAVSTMDWDGRVRFMRGAMKRLEPFLPPEMRKESPERFVRDYEKIVRAYVKSLDRVGQLLRTM